MYKRQKEGDTVVDLGAAPGGWSQVALEKVGEEGLVIGVDLNRIKPFPEENFHGIRGDFTTSEVQEKVMNLIGGKAKVVISDASPSLCGIKNIDQLRSIDLTNTVIGIADNILEPKGNLVMKVFQGPEYKDMLTRLKKKYRQVKTTKGKKTKITAKKKGKCNITARTGKKKVIIKVTVKGTTPKPTETPKTTPAPTAMPATPIPTTTPTPMEPTATPGAITGGSITDTPTGTPTTDTEIYMNETCGVSIGISDVKNTSGTLTIKNTSGHDIFFGLEFSIQKYENGQWNTLKTNEIVIPAIGILVHDKNVYSNTIQWKDSYGTLSEGTYRIVKTIYMGEQNKSIASAFVIEKETVNQK